MTKEIIKEIIIIILLAIAIILILGVLLYEYVPSNKIIPEKVAYTTPENVKQELQADSNVDNEEVVITYQIDSTDLNNYRKIQEYVPGKKNPFQALGKENVVNGNETTGQATGQTTPEPTKPDSNTNSTGETSQGYLPNKGTK